MAELNKRVLEVVSKDYRSVTSFLLQIINSGEYGAYLCENKNTATNIIPVFIEALKEIKVELAEIKLNTVYNLGNGRFTIQYVRG